MKPWKARRTRRLVCNATTAESHLRFPPATYLPNAPRAPELSPRVLAILAQVDIHFAWQDDQLWRTSSGDWDVRYIVDAAGLWSQWDNAQQRKSTIDNWQGSFRPLDLIQRHAIQRKKVPLRSRLDLDDFPLIWTWLPGGRQYIEAHGLSHVDEMNAASLARFHVTEGPYLDHGIQPLAYLDGELVAAGPPATPASLSYWDLDADYVLDALAQPEGDGRLYVPLDLSL